MINFIRNIVSGITGDIKSVVRWITHLIAAVYSFINREFMVVERYATEVYHAAYDLFGQAWQFILSVYNLANYIIHVIIGDLIQWVQGLYGDILSYAQGVWRELVTWVDWLRNAIVSAIHDVVSWVIRDIYDPIKNFIDGIYHWVTHEGAFVYYYITHPDKLATLLAGWLWSHYIDLLKRHGRTIGKWLLHSLRGLTHDFMSVIEDIMAGII